MINFELIPCSGAQGGAKTFENFKANQSIINKPSQGYPETNPSFGGPYGGLGNQPSFPQDTFGGTGGLPDFTKFDNATPQTGNLNPGKDFYMPVDSFGTGNNQIPGTGFNTGGEQPKPRSAQPRKTPDFYKKSEKAKDLCKRALSELEYKRVKQFKEDLEAALDMLESIDK